MDGFDAPTLRPVVVLAATNLAEHLDEALRRRFDREIEVPPPDRAARAAYLRHEFLYRQSTKISEAVIGTLASRSAGMTIADLRRIVNEAAVMAAQRASVLTDAIVEEAFEKIRMGEANKTPDAATLERVARHEAGHALINWLSGNLPVQVTIVGRGSAGGYVEKEAQEEKIIYTRGELEQMICQAMGGRAAELIYYGDADGLSTGVASDLRAATYWAQRMITEFGMSELGQVFVDTRRLPEGALADKVSVAAERIVHAQLERAVASLREHQGDLDRLSSELLSKNRLSRADLERILTSPS
jgi:ATP-dependent Zn protease